MHRVPFTVAVVDDDVVYRQFLKMLLGRSRSVSWIGEASDGREAIALVAAKQPDVLILDNQMPILSGLDALPLIRAASPTTRIVFHSGSADETLPGRARAAGAHAVLPKGTDFDLLVPSLTASLAAPG